MTDRETTGTPDENLSTEHQKSGDAKQPSDTLDRGRDDDVTIPRRTSLTDEEKH